MTFDNDYTFGATRVDCDMPGCNGEEEIDGFDGHPLPWADVSKEIKEHGWTIKKQGDSWMHVCPRHDDMDEW